MNDLDWTEQQKHSRHIWCQELACPRLLPFRLYKLFLRYFARPTEAPQFHQHGSSSRCALCAGDPRRDHPQPPTPANCQIANRVSRVSPHHQWNHLHSMRTVPPAVVNGSSGLVSWPETTSTTRYSGGYNIFDASYVTSSHFGHRCKIAWAFPGVRWDCGWLHEIPDEQSISTMLLTDPPVTQVSIASYVSVDGPEGFE